MREDLSFIPSFADWVRRIRPEPWMGRAQPIHREVDPFAIPIGATVVGSAPGSSRAEEEGEGRTGRAVSGREEHVRGAPENLDDLESVRLRCGAQA